MKATFRKGEKLKSEQAISRLFKEGRGFHAYPFRWVWMEAEALPYPAQVAVSVSKRKFRLAVSRNRIKRLAREAWRLEKADFYDKLDGGCCQIMLIYTGKEELHFELLRKKLRKGMDVFLGKEWGKRSGKT